MRQTRKPSLLLVFLFLAAAAHSEIPDHIRLIDDISNDFVTSACGRQPATSAIPSEEAAASGPVEGDPPQIVLYFRLRSDAELFGLSGQDYLLLWSIQRT
jgi:hypothetical protein